MRDDFGSLHTVDYLRILPVLVNAMPQLDNTQRSSPEKVEEFATEVASEWTGLITCTTDRVSLLHSESESIAMGMIDLPDVLFAPIKPEESKTSLHYTVGEKLPLIICNDGERSFLPAGCFLFTYLYSFVTEGIRWLKGVEDETVS